MLCRKLAKFWEWSNETVSVRDPCVYSASTENHHKHNICFLEDSSQRATPPYYHAETHQQPPNMAPTTRASIKKTAVAEAREIVSWTSAVTGEILYYERFHTFEEEGEVLFVQLRMTDDGELVPWTIDSEDGTVVIRGNDVDMLSEEIQKMEAPQ